jgi:hypothetical protein
LAAGNWGSPAPTVASGPQGPVAIPRNALGLGREPQESIALLVGPSLGGSTEEWRKAFCSISRNRMRAVSIMGRRAGRAVLLARAEDRRRKPRFEVHAFRCPACGYQECCAKYVLFEACEAISMSDQSWSSQKRAARRFTTPSCAVKCATG